MPAAAKKYIEPIQIDNAQIQWRNFAGEERLPFNEKGKRNFVIMLDSMEQYEALQDLGWAPKLTKRKEDDPDSEPRPFLPVTVKFGKGRPPRVKVITSRGMMSLDEDTIFSLDFANIEKADIKVRAFQWEFNGREGVKAYLESIYVTIREDELEKRYSHIPEIDMSGNPVQALTTGEDYQNPFANDLEDLGEVAINRHALEQGRGY